MDRHPVRLGTVRDGTRTRAFVTDGGVTRYFEAPDVGKLLESPCSSWVGEVGPSPAASDLVQPILRPRKIICVGLNYFDHAKEVGKPTPLHPTLFAKFATALIGPTDHIQLPTFSNEIDWEAELAIVMGASVRHADETKASAAILGYTVLNDVSVRDWQRRTSEWLQGKTFDRTTPVGPVIVTADEFDPTKAHEIRTTVDGHIEQRGTTTDMIFRPASIVSYISTFMTLEPGDIIATGTPAGVGFVQRPARFLRAGSTLETFIEGIGTLTNTCVASEVTHSTEEAALHGHD